VEGVEGIAVEAGEAVASSRPAWPCSPSSSPRSPSSPWWPSFLAVLFLDVVELGAGQGIEALGGEPGQARDALRALLETGMVEQGRPPGG
jgi:hypothetical protein